MCTYNGARFILEQLESIANQTQLPDEVIVCDDCSSDGTLDVVARFASNAHFMLSYHKNPAQLGVAKNFERAISLCTGDIIFLCDQDDVWLPQKIEKMIAVFHANEQVKLVFSNAFITDSKLNRLGYTVWDRFGMDKKSQSAITGKDPLSFLIRNYAITGATMAFRASLKDKISPIPKVWIHDAWIVCMAASQGSIATVVEPLILYRQHEANVIGGRRLSLREKFIRTRQMPPDDIELDVSRFIELLNKFKSIAEPKVRLHHLIEINSKIEHLRARKEMYFLNFSKRLMMVMRELFKLSYFKFSKGFVSAITDLILRNGMARKR